MYAPYTVWNLKSATGVRSLIKRIVKETRGNTIYCFEFLVITQE